MEKIDNDNDGDGCIDDREDNDDDNDGFSDIIDFLRYKKELQLKVV